MKPAEFKAWRKGLGLKQKDAADMLGMKKRVIQYYEKGKRDGKAVEIPLAVELACWALSQGVGGFDGKTTTALPPIKREEDAAPEPANDPDSTEAGVNPTA